MQALLEGRPGAALPDGKPNPFIFASPGKSGHVAEPRSARQQVLTNAGIPHLSIDGLRRTFALMGEHPATDATKTPCCNRCRALPRPRPALATALFREGYLSLMRAARLVAMSVSDFAGHLSRLGIPVVRLDAAETARDLDTLDAWIASS